MWAATTCPWRLIATTVLLVLAGVNAQNFQKGEWIQGRATFYGGTDDLMKIYHERGGIDSFGIIEWGSCGYTQSNGELVYKRDMYAALADTNWDYPGSCGRCYEVRCRSGLVNDRGSPVKTSQFYYLATVDSSLKDSQGRGFPGNSRESEELQHVKCWDDNASIIVRVGDSCPCQQKKGNITEPQFWCCGGANHMDLSYWAFEKLAHPVYGVIPTEYRPVDCVTKQPLNPTPGYTTPVIYRDDIGTGWGWRPYYSKNSRAKAKGEGLKGGWATCITSSPGGATVFFMREGTKEGYQPFKGATTLDFWVKSNTKTNDPFASDTPPGKVPGLKVFLMHDEKNLFCGREVYLNSTSFVEQDGDYYKFKIPLADFECDKGSAGGLENINRVDFSNPMIRDADYCLDNVIIASGSSGPFSDSRQGKPAPQAAPAPAAGEGKVVQEKNAQNAVSGSTGGSPADDIMKEGLGAGWEFKSYNSRNAYALTKGEGFKGTWGSCATVSTGGAVVYSTKPNAEAFKGSSRLDFFVKSFSSSTDPGVTSTPKGQVPPLKVILMNDQMNKYCGKAVNIKDLTPAETVGEWYKFKIPVEVFECWKGGIGRLGAVNRIEFGNPNIKDADFCLDNVVIVRSGKKQQAGPGTPAAPGAAAPAQQAPTPAPAPRSDVVTPAQIIQKQIEENKKKQDDAAAAAAAAAAAGGGGAGGGDASAGGEASGDATSDGPAVDPLVYLEDTRPGWQFRADRAKNVYVRTKGEGLKGGYAACLTPSPGGAAIFTAQQGATPFKGASRLDLWIKSNTKSTDPNASSTPPGKAPHIAVTLLNNENQAYCAQDVFLDDLEPAEVIGDYYKYKVDLAAFQCNDGDIGTLADVNRIDISNPNNKDGDICIDNMIIVTPRASSSASSAPSPDTSATNNVNNNNDNDNKVAQEAATSVMRQQQPSETSVGAKPTISPETSTIYLDNVDNGWQFRPFGDKNTYVQSKGAGLKGGYAACLTTSPGGAAVFVAPFGAQPFKGAERLDFWLKSKTLRLELKLSNDNTQKLCGKTILLDEFKPEESQGDFQKFKIPLVDFKCDQGSISTFADVNRIDFVNPNNADVDFCIDNMVVAF